MKKWYERKMPFGDHDVLGAGPWIIYTVAWLMWLVDAIVDLCK